MPKSGDGDLWPTTDDDKPSGGAEEGSTQQLPVPDQQEEPSTPPKASGGWFDPPSADAPEKPSAGRDEPHAKPAQQRTQPVSWPVAELEKHVKNPDAEATSFVRPLPPTPAWPGQETSGRQTAPGMPSGRDDPPSFIRPEKAAALRADPQGHKPLAERDGTTTSPAARPSSEPADTDSPPAARETAPPPTQADQAPDAEAADRARADQMPDAEAADRGRADQTGEAEAAGRARADQISDAEAADRGRADQTGEAERAGRAHTDEAHEAEVARADRAEGSGRAGAEQVHEAEASGRAHAGQAREAEVAGGAGAVRAEGLGGARADQVREAEASSRAHADEAREAEVAGRAPADQADAVETADQVSATETADRAWPDQAPEGEAADHAQAGEAEADRKQADQTREVEASSPDRAGETDRAHTDKVETASRASQAGDPEPADQTRSADPTTSRSWFAPPESGPPPADQATKRISLDSLAPGRTRAGQQSTDNLARPGHQENTAIIRRPEPPDTAASRARLDQPPARPADSATVHLTRPSLLKPDALKPDRQSGWPPPEPPRAAPQRVGPSPEPPSAQKAPRKKLLVTAIAIVAVIGIAAGVVFGVPGLSEKLGLTGEEAVAIDPPPAPISYTPGLRGPDVSAPGPTKQGVEAALAGPTANSALGTLTGSVVDPITGENLYERRAGSAITPASTGKILTAAAALLSIDHTKQLVTKVVQGDQPGEVIIVGGGDPTISSLKVGNESIYPGAPHLSELVEQVRNSGAQVQTVYIDQSRYAEPRLAASWLPADIGAGYIAPIVPAMLDGDRRDATVNYSPRTTDPGRTLVNEFAARLGVAPASSIEKKAPENAKVLGEIRSAPLTQLVDNMLDRSENTLGDVLAHEVAIQAGEEPTFDGASKAMLDVLRQNNFDVEGVVLKDGSGMSEQNKLSAKLLAQVLAVAAGPAGKDPRTAKLRPLLGGLPVAGGSGTLADRYDEGAATEGRGWVRAKTGTLTGVNSLAGIVLDKDNRPLVFAFLTSGTASNTARSALDAVSAALRSCGCR